MEEWRCRSTFFDLRTRWKSVVRFTSLPPLLGENPPLLIVLEVVCPPEQFSMLWREKSLSVAGNRTPSSPARRYVDWASIPRNQKINVLNQKKNIQEIAQWAGRCYKIKMYSRNFRRSSKFRPPISTKLTSVQTVNIYLEISIILSSYLKEIRK
jgi:hypothetical protein